MGKVCCDASNRFDIPLARATLPSKFTQKKTMKIMHDIGLAGFVLLATVCSSNGDITIDSFSGTQSAPGGTPTINYAISSGVIGGERDMIGSGLANVSIDQAIPGQIQMAFRNDINPSGLADVDLTYAGTDYSASGNYLGGLGSIDLTQGGLDDRFRIVITSIAPNPVNLFIRIMQVQKSSTNSIVLSQNPGVVDIPFSSFVHEGLGIFPAGVDFHNVGSMEFYFEYGNGQTVTIDSIMVVPEPPTASLLLLAIATLGWLIRSRNPAADSRRADSVGEL
jgi:hypothetical protein